MHRAGSALAFMVSVGLLLSGLPAAQSWASSPTTEQLVLHTTQPRVLYLTTPAGDDTAQMPGSSGLRDAAWSPDGMRLAVIDNGAVSIISADGERLHRLTTGYTANSDPQWSPDGRRLAWIRNYQLWVMNSDGTHERRLTPDWQSASTPSWSPGGGRIAYKGATSNGGPQGLYTIRATPGSTPERLGDGGNAGVAWSPDGTEIAWAVSDATTGTLYATDVASSSVRTVTTGPRIGSPDWSPSGARLAFVRGVNGTARDVFTIDDEGGGQARVTFTSTDEDAADWGRVPKCTVAGTPQDDVLEGTAGDDVVCAGIGNDRIVDSGGHDVILGGRGADRIDYRNTAARVSLDLRAGTVGSGTDRQLLSVESVFGTTFDDVIYGTDRRDVLNGYGGDDAIFGRAGDDTLNGGTGSDLLRPGAGGDDANGGDGRDSVSYVNATERVRVNLANHFAFGEGEDFLVHIEKIIGSAHDDFIVGDDGANILKGGDGEDVLDGQEGPDDLYGGDEPDYLYGREGDDWLDGGVGKDVLDGGSGDDDCTAGYAYDSC